MYHSLIQTLSKAELTPTYGPVGSLLPELLYLKQKRPRAQKRPVEVFERKNVWAQTHAACEWVTLENKVTNGAERSECPVDTEVSERVADEIVPCGAYVIELWAQLPENIQAETIWKHAAYITTTSAGPSRLIRRAEQDDGKFDGYDHFVHAERLKVCFVFLGGKSAEEDNG